MKHFIFIFCFFIFVTASGSDFAYLLKVEGGINPASQDYIKTGLERASRDGAKLVIIELNTPGGLLTSTRKIVQSMLKSKIPIVVYISPSGAQAGSAGVMITLASHVAVMAPATNIGAASPVASTGKDIGKTMSKKIENDTIAFVKSIAEHRKRNIEWAELSVKKSSSITAKEALKKNVIDLIAKDMDELLIKINNKKISLSGKTNETVVLKTDNLQIKPIEMNLMQKIIMLISEPNIAYVLMMAGMLGLYVEFTNPGLIFPGVVGAVCLTLSFISFQTLPINVGALILIVLGVGFLIAEIFVTSFGVLSIGGLISLFIGSIFLIDSTATDATISYEIIIPTILTLSGFILFAGILVLKARFLPKATGGEAMLGKEAMVEVRLSPEGKVHTDASLWSAESEDGSIIEKGETVKITKLEGLKLFVKKSD